MENILSMLIFFPAAAATIGILVDKNSIKEFAVVVSIVEFILSILLLYHFDTNDATLQFVQQIPLIEAFGISYIVGVDGISLFLIIMLTFMTMISVIALGTKKHKKNLIITIFYLEMTMVGVFASLDVMLFYIFWELTLIPMFYMIGYWGGKKKYYAAIKFFIYTFTGSLIMLIGILYFGYIYHQTTGDWSFSLLDWNEILLPFEYQFWLFLAFFLGFAVKVPMFPFHTWLPLAHGEAPTIGSVVLASILLKMETYGFIRFSLSLFPDASLYFVWFMATLALIAIIYTAILAYAQDDMKQLIAYSSISHMGVIILGVFSLNNIGIAGSVFLMISHGLVSGALFICVGVLYNRKNTKFITSFGGLAKSMPIFATIYAIVLFASISLPLTIGFVGEYLSLLGFFKASPILASIAGLIVILGAVYMLSMFRRTFFGEIKKEEKINDLNKKEFFALGSIVVLIFTLGIYPNFVLKPLNNSVSLLTKKMEAKAVKQETKDRLKQLNMMWEIK